MRKKSMNKAVKGLSLALALSMGLSFVPGFGAEEAEAAAKSGVVRHGKKTVYSSKKGTSVFIGGKKLDLDLIIKGKNITKNVKWTSSKGSVLSVNKKTGKLTAKKNGKAVITAVYKNKKYKALVKVYTRAESVSIEDNGVAVSEVTLKEGESKTLNVSYKISDKIAKAGGKSSTYNSYVSVDNSDLVSVSKAKASAKTFTVTGNKAGESFIDVVGSQSSAAKANADKFKVTARIKVVVAAKFGGKQTGAKKITVTGNNLTSNKGDYEVNNGLDITSVTVNESGTEAVLEMTANLSDYDYTVEFGGKTFSFKGEAAKLSKIDVPNKYLVLNGDNSSAGGTIEYKITNQFGEDVTKTVSGLNVSVSAGTGTANPAKGVIEVTGITANLPLNTPVVLNITKIDGTNVLTGKFDLTLAAKAKASTVSVKGVYNVNTKKPYSLAVNSADNVNARLLVEVKDQYGRRMKSTDGVNILAVGGLTGLGINGTTVYSDLVEVDGVDYIAIPFTGISTLKSGSVDITFIALFGTSGSNTTKTTINIAGTKQVSKLTVTAPAEVYAGEVAYFNYSATNDAGQAITDYATLTDANYGVKLPEAFSFENTANGTAKLKYDATKDNNVKTVTWSAGLTQMPSNALFTVAANMQPSMVTFNVLAPAVPSNIRSLSLDGVLKGGTTENVLPKVKILDNKGRELTNLSAYSNYYLGVKKNGSGTKFSINTDTTTVGDYKFVKLSELNSKSLKFVASNPTLTGYESESFTFAIHKDATGNNPVAGSEINVKVTASDLSSLSNFSLSLPSAVYAADGNAGYDSVGAVVVGKTSDGTSVQLGNNDFILRDLKGLVDSTGKKLVPSQGKEEAKRGDFTDTVTAIVNNGGTEVSKTITVSAKAPSVTKVEAKASQLSAGALNANAFNAVRDALVITDNYTSEANGVQASTALGKSMLQGVKLVSSTNSNLITNWNNTNQVTFQGAAAGDIVTIQVTFINGVTGTFSFKLTA